MADVPRKRHRDKDGHSCGVAQGSKRRGFLDMIHLLKLAFDEIKGPEMFVRIAHCDGGLKRVSINFDASKLPFQIKFGAPEQGVLFVGSKFLSIENAKHDALMKVALYLRSKFGVHIVDRSYEKLCIAEKHCLDILNSVEETVGNIKSMVCNWKASVGILENMHSTFAGSTNPLYIAVAGKVINVKCNAEACLDQISEQMMVTLNEHYQYSKDSLRSSTKGVLIIKIPETEIVSDLLLSLGGKAPKFSNTLVDNDMFIGKCKIILEDSCTLNTSRKTNIQGDVKKSAYEAECSSGAKATSFLERFIGIEVEDLNFSGLVEKNEILKCLECVKSKYGAFEHHIAAEWRSMITEVKGMVNGQYAICKHMGLNVDEYDKIECSQFLDESIGDITFLFDFCTIGLEHAST